MYSSLYFYNGFYKEAEHFEDIIMIPDLTDKTLSSIYKNPSVLLCYAPWCSHCIQFKPVFLELAKASSSIPVKFYQLDATEWPMSADKFEITGYPTIFFISKNQIISYSGVRSIPLIQTWIKSMLLK